jgi:signal transduction histidine kinase/CHASE3 domain sensor protein/ActR/RegA family two-component response regulator
MEKITISNSSGHATTVRGRRRRVGLAYLMALVSPCVFLIARLKLMSGTQNAPGVVLFIFPVLISAYMGGLGPGLVSTVLSGLLTAYFLLPPLHSLSISSGTHSVNWIALMVAGTILSVLMESLHRQSVLETQPQQRFSLERKVQISFAVGIVCLCAIGYFSYASIIQSQHDMGWVSHTDEVIASLNKTLAITTDAETGIRGFVITGDESYLEPYYQARRQFDAELNKVRKLTADNPQQQSRLDAFDFLLTKRLGILQAQMEARQQKGFDAAEKIVASGEGQRLHDQLRQSIAEMEAAELALLSERSLKAQRSVNLARFVIVMGSGFALSMVLVAWYFIGRDFAGAQQARNELWEANYCLEQRVQKRTAELALVNENLVNSRERLSLALDVAQLGTWDRYFPEDRMEWSPRALAALGLAPDAALTFEEWMERIEPGDCKKMRQLMQDAHSANLEIQTELYMTWPDGTPHWLAVSGRYYSDKTGQPFRLSGVIEEITQQKKMEESQLRTQKIVSLGTLAGGIAHEFNNILLAIGGNAEFAMQDLPSTHPAQESLQQIRKSSRRATDLVRQIMAFSRPQDQNHEILALEPVVAEVFKLTRATIPSTIALNSEIAPDLPLVSANEGQIHQVVINLVANAASAIGSHAGAIDLRLYAADVTRDNVPANLEPGRHVVLEIKDNGCGMDRETRQRIFDPFFTTKGLGQGTGMGLSVVDGIVRSHGGTITVYSEPDKGTIFRAYFPAAGRVTAVTQPESAPTIAQGENRRVLYVDDEEALVTLITRRLTRMGYKVSGFTDPASALQEFSAAPGDFDAFITDLAMPHLSGFDLSRKVLELRPNIPVVMTSGYVQPKDEEMARQIGIREIILKPSTTDDLCIALDKLLRDEPKAIA